MTGVAGICYNRIGFECLEFGLPGGAERAVVVLQGGEAGAVGLFDIREEQKVKKVFVSVILFGFLCALVLAAGCLEQPGETAAAGHRRHLRKLRFDRQQLMRDVDYFFLMDKPSELSHRRVLPEISEPLQ